MLAMKDTQRPVPSASPRRLNARDPRLVPWRMFQVAHAVLNRRLDEDLRREQGMSLAEYVALLQIVEAPGRRLRMSRLAESIVLSRSGVTRLVDRLEEDGLVSRSTCTADGRGAEAVLTERGLERMRRAARTHLHGIEQYFVGVLPDPDLETLERSFRRVVDGVRSEGRDPAACAVPDDLEGATEAEPSPAD
jgi:DNA-binding MarR family transcriptional regulator